MEVKHANGCPRIAPFLPEQRLLLKNLWEKLPQECRQRTLQTLSQVVAQQILPPPHGEKEVAHDNC
jgi:hypothetical protein